MKKTLIEKRLLDFRKFLDKNYGGSIKKYEEAIREETINEENS